MKVLMINKFLYPNGGSETYMFDVGRTLESMGHEVQYFGMEHEGRTVGNRAESYTEDMSFRPIETAGMVAKLAAKAKKATYPFKIVYSRDARKKIRVVLEDFHPDVVHMNNINFQITPSIIDEIKEFDPSIRIVYTAHDYQWVCPNHMMKIPSTGEVCVKCIDGAYENCTANRCIHNSKLQSVLGTREARFYQKRETYKLVDTIIAPSNFMKEKLEHNPQLKGRIVAMHNAVDVTEDMALQTKKHSGLEEKRYCLYFGRYDQEKGVDVLLEAAAELPDVTFAFAGRGELSEEIRKLDNCIDLGFQNHDDMISLIRGAAFVVIPSVWYENCPYSVMEAELYGTPVIASSIGGIPELVVEGITGELFESGNSDELTKKISTLWNDSEKLELLRDGCRKLKEGELDLRFDSNIEYCDKLLKIYKGEPIDF